MTIHFWERAQCGEPTDFAEPPIVRCHHGAPAGQACAACLAEEHHDGEHYDDQTGDSYHVRGCLLCDREQADAAELGRTVFVRARGAGMFHLARVPRDAALCGQQRPRAGWWDVYQKLDWPEATCLACTRARARGEGAG